ISSSIVVRDATGLIVFVENLDYLVRVFPDRVEITRVVGGRIVNGQTVLISYDLLPQPENTVTNNTFHASARYDFEKGPLKGAGLYARYFLLDQSIESDFPSRFTPNSLRDTTVGADYRFWDFTVGGEYEWHHSDVAPYDAAR